MQGKKNLGFVETSTKMLYLDLKAVVEDYAVANDSDAFEAV